MLLTPCICAPTLYRLPPSSPLDLQTCQTSKPAVSGQFGPNIESFCLQFESIFQRMQITCLQLEQVRLIPHDRSFLGEFGYNFGHGDKVVNSKKVSVAMARTYHVTWKKEQD